VCNGGTSQILESLGATSDQTLEVLRGVPELSQEVAQMALLLESSTRIVAHSSEPVPGQLTSRAFVQFEFRQYRSLLERLVGPPVSVGRDSRLGLATAERALAALRRGEVQAALSALFLTSLCAPRLEDPATEALTTCCSSAPGRFRRPVRARRAPERNLAGRDGPAASPACREVVGTAVQVLATFGGQPPEESQRDGVRT